MPKTIERISLAELTNLAAGQGGRVVPSRTHYTIVEPLCAWCRGNLAACQRGDSGCCGFCIDNGAYTIYNVLATRPGQYLPFVSSTELKGQPMTPSPQTFWVCSNCPFAIHGGPEQAHRHHQESGKFSHWLYEFRFIRSGSWAYEPTGREIHTSDTTGSYYLQPGYPVADVYEAIARHHINAALLQNEVVPA